MVTVPSLYTNHLDGLAWCPDDGITAGNGVVGVIFRFRGRGPVKLVKNSCFQEPVGHGRANLVNDLSDFIVSVDIKAP